MTRQLEEWLEDPTLLRTPRDKWAPVFLFPFFPGVPATAPAPALRFCPLTSKALLRPCSLRGKQLPLRPLTATLLLPPAAVEIAVAPEDRAAA